MPAAPLEEAIWREVSTFARDPGPVLEELTRKLRNDVQERKPLEKELEAIHGTLGGLDGGKQRLLTVYRKGRLEEADLEMQLDELAREKKVLVSRREELTKNLMSLQERETRLITAETVLSDLRQLVEDADEAAKAGLIRGLVQDVVVYGGPRMEVTYCFAPRNDIDPGFPR